MRRTVITLLLALALAPATAADATLRVNAAERHQRITGFGGFVCSPTFGYNHMTAAEINKVWGKGSTLGCNIARIYLPIGRGAWSQSLATARQLKQMGLTVFASPWGQPAEWKTNNSSNAVQDGEVGYLKEEHYADYAQYLNDYVDYLADNGVALDAISMQNEPDMRCDYAGCIWTPDQVARFVAAYGASMHCPLIAAESVGFSDSYANALLRPGVAGNFSIYGAHQYGGLQTAYRQMAGKGKEIWMTEYLINWNENSNGNDRDFSWDTDGFDFARAVNLCMVSGVNAWVHYATKRYYAMIGDGLFGTASGAITKRGYVLGQFARYVTGYTRVGHTFSGAPGLEGSAYLSATGDTVAAVIINSGGEACRLRVDLPFYTARGRIVTTNRSAGMRQTAVTPAGPTFRPVATIPAKSVCTVVFSRHSERPVSEMTGQRVNYDMIEAMVPSKASFGTAYRLSGARVTFDHSHPLLSANTTAANGQLDLGGSYSRLVVHVNSVTSTMNLTSANTTLHYVNASGRVASHNYGTLDLSAGQDFDLVFDLSRATLADGCRALLAITNNNWTSALTMQLGDVYLKAGSGWGFSFGGTYSQHDSNLLDCREDADCLWMDMTAVSGLAAGDCPLGGVANGNCLLLAADNANLATPNTLLGDRCADLRLEAGAGGFHAPRPFTAEKATLTVSIDGARMVALPFEAAVPQGVAVYTLESNGASLAATPLAMGTIPAAQPVLVEARGTVTFAGTGEVSTPLPAPDAALAFTFERQTLSPGDYVLGGKDGNWGFERVETGGVLAPFGACLAPGPTVTAAFLPVTGTTAAGKVAADGARRHGKAYHASGRVVAAATRGVVIDGKKTVRRAGAR